MKRLEFLLLIILADLPLLWAINSKFLYPLKNCYKYNQYPFLFSKNFQNPTRDWTECGINK